ncbi:MAG: proton-conducting transporter membrane subunit [Armatimonadota bacterium]
MTDGQLLIGGMLAFAAGAVLTALLSRKRLLCGWIAFISAALGSIWTMQVALSVFTSGTVHITTPYVVPYLDQALVFEVNAFSAVFMFITALLAVVSTLFSVRYMLHYEEYDLVRYYPLLLLFFGSIIALLSVHNLLYFLVFWELMTLASWALVAFETKSKEASRSALIYFIASHVATGLMVGAIVLLQTYTPDGSFAFSAIREAIGGLLVTNPALVHLSIGLFVVAAATKAGILPFGFWLPHAHPVAPSPFSAVLSGCMVKMGVYRALLVFTVLLPVTAASTMWGMVLALLGIGSIIVGTFTALRQVDTKRLLAFSTIGQMGYIWLGIGVGVALLPIDLNLAILSLVAGVFHAVNHAAFKGLLFLNAGAALYRTGTRDMNQASGLIRIMPYTAIAAVVGSLAIGAIPGFNGFASKWMVVESSLLAGMTLPLMIFLGLTGIFVSAVTLAYVLKLTGAVFLGDLHVAEDVQQGEVPAGMVIAQYIPVVFCIGFGIFPMLAVSRIHTAITGVVAGAENIPVAAIFGTAPQAISIEALEGAVTGAWGPATVALAFIGCLALVAIITRIGSRSWREVPVWLCGEQHDTQECRYPVQSFMLVLNRCFAWMYPAVGLPMVSGPRWLLQLFGVQSADDTKPPGVLETEVAEASG